MAKLYIVGTPIGNLKDITYRAVETLKMCEYIACEDTRHSLPLLSAYDIHSKLIAYHKFNEAECSNKLIELIRDGNNVAIITDAGMPSISDPGAEVISRCHEGGVEVELVPGPTAFASAVALSGIKDAGFTFIGFLPDKKADKVSILTKVDKTELPIIIYVAPHDLKKTASDLLDILGDRTVRVCRELTKIHESVTVTTLSSFECEERGEIVMIIDGKKEENPYLKLSVKEHLLSYINDGMDKKDAIKKVAQERGIPKNDVYQESMKL